MILYFSATGNGKYCAERIAHETGDRIQAMSTLIKTSQHVVDCGGDEVLGIVTPTYDWDLPTIVADFLRSATFVGTERIGYVFLLSTSGAMPGYVLDTLAALMVDKGLPPTAQFVVSMPSNVFTFVSKDRSRMQPKLEQGDSELATVIEAVQGHRAATSNHKRQPQWLKDFVYRLYVSRQVTAAGYYATDDCIGCGTCVRACPLNIIRLEDKRPVWTQEHCAFCLGCYHRCPKAAIQHGKKTARYGRYTHPDVKLP